MQFIRQIGIALEKEEDEMKDNLKNKMKQWWILLLGVAMAATLLGCSSIPNGGKTEIPTSAPTFTVTPTPAHTNTPTPEPIPTPTPTPAIEEEGWFYDAENVALYLHVYGHLPDNYITKSEANALGWRSGSVERVAPGYAIGGDYFQNREGLLPKKDGRQYYECDIDTDGGKSRGSKRIVFSNDGLIYYTTDHYRSFTLLYGEE